VVRGGYVNGADPLDLQPWYLFFISGLGPAPRFDFLGFRCSRTP
jgi:hypothetical protein